MNNSRTLILRTRHEIQSKWPILIGAAVLVGLFAAFGLNRSTQAQHFTAKVGAGRHSRCGGRHGNDQCGDYRASWITGFRNYRELNVDFNSRVHRGDIVALIDPALFQGALLQASADFG